MAKSLVTVNGVSKFTFSGTNRDRTITTVNVQVLVDSDFQIDGVSMPTPNEYFVEASPMTLDAKRLPGNGQMIAPYLGTAFNVTWKYKLLNAAQYKLIYDTYVKSVYTNKNMFHTLKTLDMNTLQSKSLTIYTQDKFGYKPYMIDKNGMYWYRDVELTMVDRAGEV